MWLMGVVSRRRVWLVGVGGINGCGCEDVYRFSSYYLSLLLLYLFFFTAASLLFVNKKKVFCSLYLVRTQWLIAL